MAERCSNLHFTPCASFTGAYAKTAAGGEITCVDSGNYAGASVILIATWLTINCENAIGGSYAGAVSGVVVLTAATDTVTLRGLDFDGAGNAPEGLIKFVGAGALHVHKTKLNNATSGNGSGIIFNPTGPAKLVVSDSVITRNGFAGFRGGIVIKPAAGVQADVSINRTRIDRNADGIFADGTDGGTIHGVVRDSVVSGSILRGIVVDTTATNVILLVENTTVANNKAGLVAYAANAGLAVSNSSIMFNETGLYTQSGRVIGSYQNNNLGGNGTDGAFNASAPQQ